MALTHMMLNRIMYTGTGTVIHRDEVREPAPVRKIEPPKTSEPAEPAEPSTLAAIILRRNLHLYKECGTDEDKRFLYRMFASSFTRTLTNEEAKKALALITWYKARQ